jgi:hypothetical protein
MHRLFFLSAITTVIAGPAVVFDYGCIPNVACTVMAIALSQGGIGLSSINDYTIGSTLPMHRSNNVTFACPSGYCKGADEACMEYPFSSTGNTKRKYRCVPANELKMLEYQLSSSYISNNIGHKDSFHVGVSNIPDVGCV